jgi:polycomb protein SUZ12
VGTSEVPINPSENQPPPKAPTVSIPNESFSLNNGHVAKTYMLLLRVYCMSNSSCLMQNCDVEGNLSYFYYQDIIYSFSRLFSIKQ